MKPLPELYAYILRNILRCAGERQVITAYGLFKSMRKVVYKAPMPVFREIIKEFLEDYNVLRELNKTNFQIHLNKQVRQQLRRLNESTFPINV